jgi:hypothetical protein
VRRAKQIEGMGGTRGVGWLRAPGENTELVVCIVANALIVALAFAVVIAGSDWLETHPFVARHIESIRAFALAGIVALPAMPFSRRIALQVARGDGVRVGDAQFTELHEQFLCACRKLMVEPVPELYLARGIKGPSVAYSTREKSVIVVNADLIDANWRDGIDWLSFAMAGAVGSLCLGHTRWWVELLTGYAARVPVLRTPLLVKRTYSRDRCAAYVIPHGIRGLLVEAVGKDAVRSVSIGRFVAQSRDPRGVWDSLSSLRQKCPTIGARARALYEAGLFDETRDLGR